MTHFFPPFIFPIICSAFLYCKFERFVLVGPWSCTSDHICEPPLGSLARGPASILQINLSGPACYGISMEIRPKHCWGAPSFPSTGDPSSGGSYRRARVVLH